MSTNTKYEGATWPSVESHHRRMKWIARIMEDDQIECQGEDPVAIAHALLRYVAAAEYEDAHLRFIAFRAGVELEKRRE